MAVCIDAHRLREGLSTDGDDGVPLEGEPVASVRAVVPNGEAGDRQDDVVQVAGQVAEGLAQRHALS